MSLLNIARTTYTIYSHDYSPKLYMLLRASRMTLADTKYYISSVISLLFLIKFSRYGSVLVPSWRKTLFAHKYISHISFEKGLKRKFREGSAFGSQAQLGRRRPRVGIGRWSRMLPPYPRWFHNTTMHTTSSKVAL